MNILIVVALLQVKLLSIFQTWKLFFFFVVVVVVFFCFFCFFQNLPGRFTQIKKKKMWKNKFSEDEFEMTVDVWYFHFGFVDFYTIILHRIELFTLFPYENPPSDTDWEIQNIFKKIPLKTQLWGISFSLLVVFQYILASILRAWCSKSGFYFTGSGVLMQFWKNRIFCKMNASRLKINLNRKHTSFTACPSPLGQIVFVFFSATKTLWQFRYWQAFKRHTKSILILQYSIF